MRISHFNDFFENNVFEDERIIMPEEENNANLPKPLQKARLLEKKKLSRPQLFLRQARLLADYEDDYEIKRVPFHYFATYQVFLNSELRSYFSWRTKIKNDKIIDGPSSFFYLYINEIINQIGFTDPMVGFKKLMELGDFFGKQTYHTYTLNDIINDYIVYYDLPLNLLPDKKRTAISEQINILNDIKTASQETIIQCLKSLAPAWLKRSRFYAAYSDDMDHVIYNTLKGVDLHYEKKCSRNMLDSLFGSQLSQRINFFNNSVFCNPLKRKSYSYSIYNQCIYEHQSRIWLLKERRGYDKGIMFLERLTKAIDHYMREKYDYGSSIKHQITLKWLINIINETIDSLLTKKQAARIEEEKHVITPIDISQLSKIRADALETQEKLAIEELEDDEAQNRSENIAEIQENDLDSTEIRFLKCLLNGKSINWLSTEGIILSVLVDGINEKMYEIFGDSILDDSPQIIEDYRDGIEELINK